MSEVFRGYKRKEKMAYAALVEGLRSIFRSIRNLVRRTISAGAQQVTFMVVPHSDRPAGMARLSRFAVAAIVSLIVLAAGFSVFSAFRYSAAIAGLATATKSLAEARKDLDDLRDGTEALAGAAQRFETGLAAVIAAAGKEGATAIAGAPVKNGAPGTGGATLKGGATATNGAPPVGGAPGKAGVQGETAADMSVLASAGLEGIFDQGGEGSPAARDIARLATLTAYLNARAPSIEQMAGVLAGQRSIMGEIPNIWPVEGGIGHISMYYGQNENPFSTGKWYLHNGIDISTFRTGDRILATADGTVADTGYDGSLGMYLILRHSHGFFTRYGHLQSLRVGKGQKVAQGQVIATLGNTGVTTGPHLHYEVHLGTSVIDPLRFLNVRSSGISVAPRQAASPAAAGEQR